MMTFVFVFTGAFGLMLAVAFARTKSIALPIGLHLGWNVVSYLGFSAGPLGRGLLVRGNGATRMEATGLADFLLDMVLPMFFVASVIWYLMHGNPRDGSPASAAALPPSAA